MEINARVLCKPKQLPMVEFQDKWAKLNDFQKYQKYSCAKRYAQNKLGKQKLRTKVGILGKPQKELLLDPKFKDKFLCDSVAIGERFAQTALEAELLVMLVCEVPSKEWRSYIGRSQYPKIVTKPINTKNNIISFYKDIDLTFWGTFKTNFTHCIQLITKFGLHSPKTYKSILELQSRSEEIDNHQERIEKDSEFSSIFSNFINMQREEIDINTINNLLEYTTNIFLKLLATCVSDKSNSFKQHVREQLSKGGGTLFKYISKLDKEYLNVDYKMRSDANFGNSPEPFLLAQCKFFLSSGNPLFRRNAYISYIRI